MRIEPLCLLLAQIACTLVATSSAKASSICDEADKLVTSTPAPPTLPQTWKIYLDQTKLAVHTDADIVLIGDSLVQFWDTKTWAPIRAVNLGVAGDRLNTCYGALARRIGRRFQAKKF